MGLYKPAKRLQMPRKYLDHVVLHPGELPFVTTEQLAHILKTVTKSFIGHRQICVGQQLV